MRTLAILLCFAAPLTPALAAGPPVLADFDLTAPDGSIVNTRTFPSDPRWLILYLQPNCKPCDTVLQLIKNQDRNPSVNRRLVIIGGGMSLSDLRRYRTKFPDLASARWYIGSAKETRASLKASGAPVVLGISRRTIMWLLNGVPSDTRQLRVSMEAWTK